MRRGWPRRTRHAIEQKCNNLGVSTAVNNSSIITLLDARTTLGWSRWTAGQLTKNADMRAILRPVKHGVWYVERKRLAKLALLRPELFHGVSPDDLYFVIEDRDIVDSIRDCLTFPKKSYQAIRCVETNREWNNTQIAAKYFNVSIHSIQRSIKTGKPVACLNLTFERIRPLRGRIKQQPRAKHD